MYKIFRSCTSSNFQYVSSICKINVRWITKPRWLPIAKGKMFKIKQAREFPEDESVEYRRLKNNWNTYWKSTKALIEDIHRENETSEEVLAKIEEDKELAWQESMRINDEWNRRLAIEREQRDMENLEKECEEARQTVLEQEELERQEFQRLEDQIRREKEAAKHFITEKNIDEHLEKILNSTPKNFCFAIDKQRRIYPGYSLTSGPESEAELETDKDFQPILEDDESDRMY